jgi:hypothetical protein
MIRIRYVSLVSIAAFLLLLLSCYDRIRNTRVKNIYQESRKMTPGVQNAQGIEIELCDIGKIVY